MRGPPPSTTGGGAVWRPGGGADRDRRGSAQLLTRLSDNDPVALLSSISEHLVKKHKGRFGTTEALLREVLKKGEHASEAMGVSRMHSKRILEDAGAQPGSRAFAASAEPEDARAPAGERALASTSYPDAKTPSPAKTPRRKPAALKSPKSLPWASDEKEQISEDGLAVPERDAHRADVSREANAEIPDQLERRREHQGLALAAEAAGGEAGADAANAGEQGSEADQAA